MAVLLVIAQCKYIGCKLNEMSDLRAKVKNKDGIELVMDVCHVDNSRCSVCTSLRPIKEIYKHKLFPKIDSEQTYYTVKRPQILGRYNGGSRSRTMQNG